MSIKLGNKIKSIMVSAANGDTYGDAERQLFRGIQSLVMPNVLSIGTNTAPVSPTFGDTYVVGTSPSGLWAGFANCIASWALDNQDGVVTTGLWEFYYGAGAGPFTPALGWTVFNQTDSFVYYYNGSAWVKYFNGVVGTANQVAISAGGVVSLSVTGTANQITFTSGSGVFSLPTSVIFPAAYSPTKTTVVGGTTTTINPALGNAFRVTVGLAITSVVLSNGVADGQEITVQWVQDGTGHAVSGFAANIHGVGFLTAGSNTFVAVPSAAASSVSSQSYTWDSTASVWYAKSVGVSSM